MRLFEVDNDFRTLGIYSGRFQPPHKGHVQAYDWLKERFDTVFVATSDKVEPPKSPFDFEEKKELFEFAGVDPEYVRHTVNPYKAHEIIAKYPAETTILLYGVSHKDKDRFEFGPKKDGTPRYLQQYERDKHLQPMSHAGYIVWVPTFEFTVLGEDMKSATEIRDEFAAANSSTQKEIIKDLYDDYSSEIHELMNSKII